MSPLPRSALGLSLGAMLVVVAAFVGTAAAQAGVQVTIQPPGSSTPVILSTDDVLPDVTDKTYTVQAGGNRTKEVKVATGVSLRALLDAAGTNSDYATIDIRGSGARPPLLLRKRQVDNQLALPVFFADAQGRMSFVLPTADGSPIPAGNYFRVPAHLFLTQRAQQRLRVEISPSSKTIEPGGTITFRARTTGVRPGEMVVYSWSLGDGRLRPGGERHVQDFPEKDGVYGVRVFAVIEGAGVSDRGYAKITVGDPDGKEQEEQEDETVPDDQTTETLGTSSPAPYAPSPTPVSPTSPTPVPATPPPPPEPADPPDVPISGTTVEGNLLADASDPPPSNILESAAKAARNPSDDSDAGVDVPEAALSIAGVLALLALGAGIENRQGRRLPRERLSGFLQR